MIRGLMLVALLMGATGALAQAQQPGAQPMNLALEPRAAQMVQMFARQWGTTPEIAAMNLLYAGAKVAVTEKQNALLKQIGEEQQTVVGNAVAEAKKRAAEEAAKRKAAAAAKKVEKPEPERPMGPDGPVAIPVPN